MIPGTDWYFRVSRGVCFTGYQLSFRVSRGVFFYRVPVVLPGFSWRLLLPGTSCPSGFLVASSFTGYQLSIRVSRGVDTRLYIVEITIAAVTNVVRALLSMRRLVMFTQMIHKCVYIIQLYFN